jgi:hypothetical protein
MIMAYTKDEYYAVKDQVSVLANKLIEEHVNANELREEIEILRAERSHWYHMYNQGVDNNVL